jgi:hypothetical protein
VLRPKVTPAAAGEVGDSFTHILIAPCH